MTEALIIFAATGWLFGLVQTVRLWATQAELELLRQDHDRTQAGLRAATPACLEASRKGKEPGNGN